MANVVITPLANTAFNGSFVNKLNANLTKLADAVNNDVLWRTVGPAGAQTMRQHLDMNSCSILNAVVDGVPMLEVKRKAYASSEYSDISRQWAVVSEAYAEGAEAAANTSEENAAISVEKARQLSQAVQDVAKNKVDITALTATVTSNKTAADATASSLSALNGTVVANKASTDSTATALSTLSSTVTSNKTAADATASSLSTLSATVSGHTTSLSSVTSTANAALPKSGGTMTGAIMMGANAINFGSYSLVSSGGYIKANTGIWSTIGYRCQDGINGAANSANYFNFNWNASGEVEVWIDVTRLGKLTMAAVSDKQLKEDISYIEEDALSQVEQWRPAKFAYKPRGALPKSALQMGFIANDLAAVSPECVTGKGLGEEWDENAPEGAYELVPVAMMAKMVRAIQQLSERLKELEVK